MAGVYDPSGGLAVVNQSPQNLATAQVTVGTSATLLAALRSGRNAITVENAATTAVYIGGIGVTIANGFLLPGVVGASITIPFQGALYGIVAASTEVVTILETF